MNEQKLLHQLIDLFKYKEAYQQQTAMLLPQDLYTLERIYFNDGIQPKEISQKYHIAPSTLTGIIDRLEDKKLIRRFRSDENRKIITLQSTEVGEKIIRKHIKEDEAFSRNLFLALSEEKASELKVLLQELIDNLKREDLFKGLEEESYYVPNK